MIRVLHVDACRIIFILCDDPNGLEGVLKLMKNDYFLVFLAVCVHSPEFLDKLRIALC